MRWGDKTVKPATSLYRMYNAKGALLYVGITCTPKRFGDHRRTQRWWRYVRRVDVEHFKTREEARAAEVEAIRVESPRHNIQNVPRPVKVKRPGKGWITGDELSERFRLGKAWALREIDCGRLKAKWDGTDWWIDESEIERYVFEECTQPARIHWPLIVAQHDAGASAVELALDFEVHPKAISRLVEETRRRVERATARAKAAA